MNKWIRLMKEYGVAFCLFLLVGALIIFGLSEVKSAQSREALRVAKESIVRGVVRCYAIEGAYPPSYDYLKENYGVRVDETKFTVFYDIFASNLMPDVTVVER